MPKHIRTKPPPDSTSPTTALTTAILTHNHALVKPLIQRHHINLTSTTLPAPPLTLAIGNPKTVALLLRLGADVNARGTPDCHPLLGGTPLHCAVVQADIASMKLLIAAGADLDARTKYVGPPVTVAAWTCADEALKVLLDAGADPTIMDPFGHTAVDWARCNPSTWKTLSTWATAHPRSLHLAPPGCFTPAPARRRAQLATLAHLLTRLRSTPDPLAPSLEGCRMLLSVCLRLLADLPSALFLAALRASPSPAGRPRFGATCSVCREADPDTPWITGRMWMCGVCADVDFCEGCVRGYYARGWKGCVGHVLEEVVWPPVWEGVEVRGEERRRVVCGLWVERLCGVYALREREGGEDVVDGEGEEGEAPPRYEDIEGKERPARYKDMKKEDAGEETEGLRRISGNSVSMAEVDSSLRSPGGLFGIRRVFGRLTREEGRDSKGG